MPFVLPFVFLTAWLKEMAAYFNRGMVWDVLDGRGPVAEMDCGAALLPWLSAGTLISPYSAAPQQNERKKKRMDEFSNFAELKRKTKHTLEQRKQRAGCRIINKGKIQEMSTWSPGPFSSVLMKTHAHEQPELILIYW